MTFAKERATSILGCRCLASIQGPRCLQVRHSSPLSRSCQESNSNLTQFQTSISAVWGRALLVLSTRLCGQQGIQLWESFPAEKEVPRENSPNNNDLKSPLCLLLTVGHQAETREHLPVSKLPDIIWYFVFSNFCSRVSSNKCECLSINTACARVCVWEWENVVWRVFQMCIAVYSEADCFQPHSSKQECAVPVVARPWGQIMNRWAGCAVFSIAVHTSYSHFTKLPSGNLSLYGHLTATVVPLFCEQGLAAACAAVLCHCCTKPVFVPLQPRK